ncbi:MAG: biotin/lipoyl-binding protein [Rhodocyclaceae bacterium]|nr:biotin/lipoyl-binding protein [Rhodocyclaceae bacterium]
MRKFRITVDGTPYEVCVEELDEAQPSAATTPRPPRPAAAAAAAAPRPAVATAPGVAPPTPTAAGSGDVVSPLAATVVQLEVHVGQQVIAGQEVAVLEAMKMNNFVHAPSDGTVTAVLVAAGDVVAEGQPLLTLA